MFAAVFAALGLPECTTSCQYNFNPSSAYSRRHLETSEPKGFATADTIVLAVVIIPVFSTSDFVTNGEVNVTVVFKQPTINGDSKCEFVGGFVRRRGDIVCPDVSVCLPIVHSVPDSNVFHKVNVFDTDKSENSELRTQDIFEANVLLHHSTFQSVFRQDELASCAVVDPRL